MKEGRTYWLDNLRGFITLLVVAHHATLAYTTFAHLDLHAYTASTHPIIDQVHSKGLDVFEDFNDVFFMSLMFLISGIFVLPAISRKGVGRFFSDRTKRLFIPFLITVTFIIPWGYLAAWKELHGVTDLKAFLLDFFTVEHWPPGPPWFIGILFIFNAIACWGYGRWLPTFQRWNVGLRNISYKTAGLFLRWYALTLILFIPPVLVFGGSAWIGIGPIAFQLSRIVLYFGYFTLGMVIGAGKPMPETAVVTDPAADPTVLADPAADPATAQPTRKVRPGLLDQGSALMRYTPLWILICVCAYIALKVVGGPIQSLEDGGHISELQARLLYRPVWALSCTASCMAFLSLFHRYFQTINRFWKLLAANAYGIYLIHWVFVLWIQYLLLPASLGPITKFALTFIGATVISWMLTDIARQIPVFKKYV